MSKKTNPSYDEFLSELMDDSGYFRFYRKFLKIMTLEESILFQHLANIANTVGAWKNNKDGWFECTVQHIETGFYGWLDRNAQQRVLKSLTGKGLIETKKVGIPAKRHVRCLLGNAIDSIKSEKSSSLVNTNSCQLAHIKSCQPIEDNESKTINSKTPELPKNASRCAPTHSKTTSGEKSHTKPDGFIKTENMPPSMTKEWARRLTKVIKDTFDIAPEKATVQERALRSLLYKVGESTTRVERVVSWYENNPNSWDVTGVKHFCNAFFSIEKKLKRSAPAPSQGSAAPPEMDEDGKWALKELSQLRWPKGSAAQLPACVAESVKNYRAYRKKLSDFIKRVGSDEDATSKDKTIASFARHIRPNSAFVPFGLYVSQWFARIHRSVVNWEDWNGNLSRYIFTESHKDFHSQGMAEAAEYGNVKLWNELMEKLK